MKRIDMLLVCSQFGKTEAAYRRLSYSAKYLRSKRLRVVCASPLQLISYGILRPEEYIVASLNVLLYSFAAYLCVDKKCGDTIENK